MKSDRGLKKHHRFSCRILCGMLTVLLLFGIAVPAVVHAEETPDETVKVAYVLTPGYQEGGEGEYKTGYGYEYLQKLATLNGWKYEYVYGTFSELLAKLERGEIDLMGNLSYTDVRAEKISYGTYEEGRESAYLYVNKEKTSIDSSDYSTLNGKTIGRVAGEIFETEWENWCNQHGISCGVKTFSSFEECKQALNEGAVDAMIEGRVQQETGTDNWEIVLQFDAAPFYFAVSKDRPDLLSELNQAQKRILDENPFYNEEVQDRYMTPILLATTSLNQDEEDWLQEHDRTVRFGYLAGFPPLCYEADDGTCKGVAADVLSAISKKYPDDNISFETVVYQDYRTMFQALRDEKINIAWPAYDDYWFAEEEEFTVTNRLVSSSMMLVYKGAYSDDTVKNIGVISTGSLPMIYGKIHYPESRIREYDSYESAISAVLSGEVGSVLYVSTTYNVDIRKNRTLQQMNSTVLPDSFGICLAVLTKDTALGSILNKGISAYGEAGITRSLTVHSAVDWEASLKEYFEQHPLVGALILAALIAMIASVVFFLVYKSMSLRIRQSQAEKEVFEQISNSDPLTGLYNRKKVFEKCRELLNDHPSDQFVMVHADMKHFRLYNTFFGDEAGDKLLCDVSDLFRKMSEEYDYWAYGRIEADVFCLFFPYNRDKYQRHLQMTLEYLKNYRKDYLIEPALGMYFVRDPNMQIESMFTRATLAAKEVRAGTPYSTVIYNEKLELELNEKQQIINDMQAALDQEQFQVYLQPKYSLRTNQIVGAEALVRWIHPDKGMISPGAFIPVFEGNGFITSLDRYMWEHVCMLLSKWQKENRPLVPISVNVSRLSMFGTSTVEFLKELVVKYEIDPRYLELELTESAYMDDPDEMKEQMNALKAAGFTVLLDDFGSGYSSLNTLRELPVDILKLDMKFLSLDQNDVRGGLVISSIVRMSKLLELSVIAEGVELPEQAEYLKGIGCEYVQGFLYTRPMPVSEFERIPFRGTEPIAYVKQPEIDHIGRILAETGTDTYAMGTVMPTPLACLEYANRKFSILRVNPEFFTEFGLAKDSGKLTDLFQERMSGESQIRLTNAFEDCIRSGSVERCVIELSTREGEAREYLCSAAYEGSFGASAAIVATFSDVTGIMKAEVLDSEALMETETRLWTYVKQLVSTKDISTATNSVLQEVMAYYNADRAYIFEFDWEDYLCSNTFEICAPGVEAVIDTLQDISIDKLTVWVNMFRSKSMIMIDDLEKLRDDPTRQDEYETLSPQDIQSLIAAPVYFQEQLVGFLGVDNPKKHLEDTAFIEGLAFFCVNESLREKEKSALQKKSMLDPLTGASNRNALAHEQKKLQNEHIPYSIVMIDVDEYKLVNDRFGHQVGDELLKRIVGILKKLFRANDMVVRYGGDEFVVVLENVGSWMDQLLLQKVAQLNDQLAHPDDNVPGVTVSAGVAFSDDCNGEDLIKNADRALYYVKHNGKNGCHIFRGGQMAEMENQNES